MIPIILIVWATLAISDVGGMWLLALFVALIFGKLGRIVLYVWALVVGAITGAWLVLFVVLALLDVFSDYD